MTNKFYPVRKKGKYAFINEQGELITDFEFDFANIFGGFKINGKFGAINTSGEIILEAKFDLLGGFFDGLASVEIDGKCGFITHKGDFVISPQYYRTTDFKNGIASILETITSSPKIIDNSGTIILAGEADYGDYSEELISCQSQENRKWGFIDIKGNSIIPFMYLYTQSFSEGKAAVTPEFINKKPNKKKYPLSGFINRENEMIIPPKFQIAEGNFSEGLCVFWDNGNGYIDDKGEIVIPAQYLVGEQFSEGLAGVQLKKNEKWGFIDKNGTQVIKPKFSHISSFENGIAEVIVGELYEEYKYGYISKNGDYIWKPTR